VRTLPLAVLLLGLAGGCRCESEPLSIRLGPLEPGESRLPDQDLNTRTVSLRYELDVRSRTDKPVTLQASLGDESTNGLTVTIDPNRSILPEGRESLSVILALPEREGPFRAEIVLSSDDLPGWSRTYELRGTKTDRPLEGRRLRLEPGRGIDLGAMRPGESQPFSFRLAAEGTEAVTLEQVLVERESGVRVDGVRGDERIEPGASLEVKGVFRCPEGPEPRAGARVQIRSNAKNAPVLTFHVSARRERDFELHPPRMPPLRTYPNQSRAYAVEVRAAQEDFVVENVTGLEPYFELGGPLPDEPARSVKVTIRLKPGAPTSVQAHTGSARFHLSTGARLAWPYQVTVLPSIHAQPPRVAFGTVTVAELPEQRVVQIVSLPGRDFEVTGAYAENGRFVVTTEHMRNMPWRVVVTLPVGKKRGDIVNDRIIIETSDEQVPKLYVDASAVVK